jgi:hypothetical protein
MKNAKKALLFILAIVLVLPFITTIYAAYDVICGEYAEELWRNGLFLGSDGSFNLDKPLTRAEGAAMLVRLLGKETEAKAGAYLYPFTDVPEWAACYVGYCYEHGLTNGISATEYGSATPMTAEQYATFVLRALGYKDNVDFLYTGAVAKARAIYLLNIDEGIYNDHFSPTGTFLRDYAVLLSYSALDMNLKGTHTLLKDTIVMPGQPDGDMPTYVAGVPNEQEPSDDSRKDSSKSSGGGTITIEYEYAANGVVDTARYYRDREEVAVFYDGGNGELITGDGWYLHVSRRLVSRSYSVVPGLPPIQQTAFLLNAETLHIQSSDKYYSMAAQDWKKDAFVKNNDLESVITFIINDFAQKSMNLRAAGYN